MEKEKYIIRMEMFNMKAILLMINLMVMEYISIKMVIIMMVNGKKV